LPYLLEFINPVPYQPDPSPLLDETYSFLIVFLCLLIK